jgi:hypothetical protein
MEPADAAEHISDAVEEERVERRAVDRFRTRAAVAIGVLAMLLAVASLGGDNATKEALNANVTVTDTWAFYQAKNIRQTANQLAADELATLLLINPNIPAAARQQIESTIERYRATVDRYESEAVPEPNYPRGTGKRELSEQAREWEAVRDHALTQDPNFDYSTALFQIAIVLGSVAIVGVSRPILGLAIVLGVAATALMLNGFFLFAELPGLG